MYIYKYVLYIIYYLLYSIIYRIYRYMSCHLKTFRNFIIFKTCLKQSVISFYKVDIDFRIEKMFHGKGNTKAIYNQNARTFGKQFNMMSSIG